MRIVKSQCARSMCYVRIYIFMKHVIWIRKHILFFTFCCKHLLFIRHIKYYDITYGYLLRSFVKISYCVETFFFFFLSALFQTSKCTLDLITGVLLYKVRSIICNKEQFHTPIVVVIENVIHTLSPVSFMTFPIFHISKNEKAFPV